MNVYSEKGEPLLDLVAMNFKASIRGTHVHISKQHAQKYVDEFTFRANERARGNQMFDLLIGAL